MVRASWKEVAIFKRSNTERMSDDKTLTKIPHFDGHYDHWSELMENLLKAKDLWSLVENGFSEPVEGTKLTATQQEYLEQILDRRTSKIVWDSMKRKFGGN